MEDGRAARPVAVGERGEEPARLRGEPGLLMRFAEERLEDRLVLVDAAGRQAIRAPGIEGLDREKHVTRRPAHDHADLGESRRVAHRIERDVVERHVAIDRRPEAAREVHDLGPHCHRERTGGSRERAGVH